jgi:hypothetical protein
VELLHSSLVPARLKDDRQFLRHVLPLDSPKVLCEDQFKDRISATDSQESSLRKLKRDAGFSMQFPAEVVKKST